FNSYEAVEKNSSNYNTIVYGPWSHGDWARTIERQAIGNVYFGDNISRDYQRDIETNFFNKFLKENGKGENNLPEAYMFDTGTNQWKSYAQWPPKNAEKKSYFLQSNQRLNEKAEKSSTF